MESSGFKHKPLNLTEDEIRLVWLRPPRYGSADIECKIVHAKLSENPRYEALSYEWGKPTPTIRLIINGASSYVQWNLWHALERLRLRDRTRVLWIDALCIDQNNISERNHQVAKMGRIYAQAKSVAVWLGLPPEPEVDYLEAFTKYPKTTAPSITSMIEQSYYLRKILSVCRLSYWHRLWIVQEIVLASDIVVYMGKEHIPFSRITETLAQLRNFKVFGATVSKWSSESVDGQSIADISRSLLASTSSLVETFVFGQNSLSLVRLLYIYKDSRCADRRDRIFGLLSIAQACCYKSITVDYGKSSFDLAGKVLEHALKKHSPPLRISEACDIHRILEAVANTSVLEPHSSTSRQLFRISNTDQHITDQAYMETQANLRGRIVGISLALDDVPKYKIQDAIYFEGNPARFVALDIQLQHYDYFRKRQLGPGRDVYKVVPAPWPVESFSTGSYAKIGDQPAGTLHQKGHATPLVVNIDEEKKLWATEYTTQCSYGILRDVLGASPEVWEETNGRSVRCQYKLAFEENGMICYVPLMTEVGDMICQFPDCEVAVVVRAISSGYGSGLFNVFVNSKRRYRIIGRAIHFLKDSGGTPSKPFSAEMRKLLPFQAPGFDVPANPINFHLDVQTLQHLTHATENT